MSQSTFITLPEARSLLAEMGIQFSERTMKRAAEPDHEGKRKLPFFVDPVDGRLKIERGALTKIYQGLQAKAENNSKA